MSTLAERIAWAAHLLRRAGVPPDQAPGDAEVLARHVLGWDLATLVAERRQPPPDDFDDRYIHLIERRCRREPVSHLVGHREFWGLDFAVTPDVLTPRPETELIVEEALARFPARDARLIADVGTGSGCVAIALAREFPQAEVIASDISEGALAVARQNARAHRLENRVTIAYGDLLPPKAVDVDLIVSNPPYVPSSERDALPPEVREFEPAAALFGGVDGLDVYRRLLPAARRAIRAGGTAIVEVGYDQAEQVRRIGDAAGWTTVRVRADLQGIPRTVVLEPRS